MAVEWTTNENGSATVVLTDEDADHYAFLQAGVAAGAYGRSHVPIREGLRIIEYLATEGPNANLAAVVAERGPLMFEGERCRVVCTYPDRAEPAH